MAPSLAGTVVITGSQGNLGTKLVNHLLSCSTFDFILLDVRPQPEPESLPFGGRCRYMSADLRKPGPWQSALDGAYAVVHFAAQCPYPVVVLHCAPVMVLVLEP